MLLDQSHGGGVKAWTNGNNSLNTIMKYNFTERGTFLAGGSNSNGLGASTEKLMFANLRGFERADAVYVDPVTADARIVYNICDSKAEKNASTRGAAVGAAAYKALVLVMSVWGIAILGGMVG